MGIQEERMVNTPLNVKKGKPSNVVNRKTNSPSQRYIYNQNAERQSENGQEGIND
jgi:hypothetical protein